MKGRVGGGGWDAFNTWARSASVRRLYQDRWDRRAEVMTCAAQAAELLAEIARPGESVLDVGCGSGSLFHALRERLPGLEYWGLDATEEFADMGRRALAEVGLPPERVQRLRLEDLQARVDHVVCLNVLSNLDNFHRPLERLLLGAARSVILRESLADAASYAYVVDRFLDPGPPMRVHVNTYRTRDVLEFMEQYGFQARTVTDRRTGGQPEMVIGHPHHWTFVVATRKEAPAWAE